MAVFSVNAQKAAMALANPIEAEITLAGIHMRNTLKAMALPGKWKLIKKCTAEQMVDIYHDLFLHSPGNELVDFPVQQIQSFRKQLNLVAPSSAMSNTTFGQFKYADNEFTKMVTYREMGEDEKVNLQVDRLVATLYLPEGETFNKDNTEALAKAISTSLFAWQKALVVEAYANIRNKVIDRCPTFWPRPEAKEGDFAPAAPTGPMWHKLHFDLAHSEAFKGFKTVNEANMYDVFDYLEETAQANLNNKQ